MNWIISNIIVGWHEECLVLNNLNKRSNKKKVIYNKSKINKVDSYITGKWHEECLVLNN